MRSLSLLERLGGKHSDRKRPAHIVPPQPVIKPQEVHEQKPPAVPPPETIKSPAPEPVSTAQEASAFAGRYTNLSKHDILQELKLAIHRRIVDEMTPEEQTLIARGEEAREQIKNLIMTYAMREMADSRQNFTRLERQQLVDDICNELLGLGPLEPLLQDDSISEIMVNGAKTIFIEQKGKLRLTDIHFYDDTHLIGDAPHTRDFSRE